MMEIGKKDISENEALQSKLWEIFGILRNEPLSGIDYYTILPILSAFNDGIVSYNLVINQESIYDIILDSISNKKHQSFEIYNSILPCFENQLKSISINGLKKILELLEGIDKEMFRANFANIFDNFLYKISESLGKHDKESIQQPELTNFILELANLKQQSKVYNPFAGVASFGVYLSEVNYYFGQELNQKTWALGVLRILAHKKQNECTLELQDSFLAWPIESKKFDLVVSHPPNGLRSPFNFTAQSIEHFLIDKSLQSLTADGKIISILPKGFLSSGEKEQKLLHFLLDEDLIDTIISLPDELFHNVGIPLIILVISKKKERPGKVQFIRTDKFIESIDSKFKRLNYSALINLIHSAKPSDDILRLIDIEQIKSLGYNINLSRYFLREIKLENGERLVKLSDILESFEGSKLNIPEYGKLVQTIHLTDDLVDYRLNLSKIKDGKLKGFKASFINESCLLLSTRLKTLKPTYFVFEETPIYKRQDMLAFKVNQSVVDYEYLIGELRSEYFQEQLDAFRKGGLISYVAKGDLLELKVKLPSILVQRARIEGVKRAFIKARENEIKLQAELLGLREDIFNDFASLKHTFRQYLSALKSNLSGTIKYIGKKNGTSISLEDTYSEKLNLTLGEHLLSMSSTISSLSKLVEQDEIKSRDIREFNLTNLLERAQYRFQDEIFTFDYKIDHNTFLTSGIHEPYWIEIVEDDFFKIFSNIVSNAIDHGFKEAKGNIIRIELRFNPEKNYWVLEVSNNGKPIPSDFTFKKLTTRGEKTTDSRGTGLGGADIKKIVSRYSGQFELITDSNSLFPVTYKISLPISQKNLENEI